MVKTLPTVQQTWVQSLDWEDPLEKGMATHFSILVWRIPMDRGAWQATVHKELDTQELDTTEQLTHRYALIQSICFSLSDLLHSV